MDTTGCLAFVDVVVVVVDAVGFECVDVVVEIAVVGKFVDVVVHVEVVEVEVASKRALVSCEGEGAIEVAAVSVELVEGEGVAWCWMW